MTNNGHQVRLVFLPEFQSLVQNARPQFVPSVKRIIQIIRNRYESFLCFLFRIKIFCVLIRSGRDTQTIISLFLFHKLVTSFAAQFLAHMATIEVIEDMRHFLHQVMFCFPEFCSKNSLLYITASEIFTRL